MRALCRPYHFPAVAAPAAFSGAGRAWPSVAPPGAAMGPCVLVWFGLVWFGLAPRRKRVQVAKTKRLTYKKEAASQLQNKRE